MTGGAAPIPDTKSAPLTPRDGPRLQIVIVDDQAPFRDAACELLEARGYEVVAEAGSAETALAAVEVHDPTGVLLDVRLGDDDGFAVCGALVRMHPQLAVLLASDGDYEHFTDLIQSCGARGFVPKTQLAKVDFGEFWPSA